MQDIELRYMRQIVSQLDKLNHDPSGEHVARITRSIEAAVGDDVAAIGSSVAQLAAMSDWTMPTIVAELAQQSRLLSDLIEVTSHPRATAARESAKYGVRMMSNGLYPEAVTEFRKSLKRYGYDPAVLLNIGLCLGAEGDDSGALAAFERSVKYGLVDDQQPTGRQIACGAAIVGALVHREAGNGPAAAAFLNLVRDKVVDCPEVDHLYADLTADAAALRRAIQVAPELALHAAVRGTPHAEEVSAELLPAVRGRLQRGRQLLERLHRLEVAIDRDAIPEPTEPVLDRGAAVELATSWGAVCELARSMAATNERVHSVVEGAVRATASQPPKRSPESSRRRRRRSTPGGTSLSVPSTGSAGR